MRKKIIGYLFVVALFLISGIGSLFVGATVENTATVSVRIEGVSKNIFYDDVSVSFGDSLTAKLVLQKIDVDNEDITIAGLDTNFITAVNDDVSGLFGGWDGWLTKINGNDPSVGIDQQILEDGDKLLLYYGDPYGAGMQFPVADASDLKSEGKIVFQSTDTTFDEEYNPVITVNPVEGATVVWSTNDSDSEFVTDENGVIVIPENLRTPGDHFVRIYKNGSQSEDERYLPLVLRFEPDYIISIQEDDSSSDVSSDVVTTTGSPETGESNFVYINILIAAVAFVLIILIANGKKIKT